MTTSTKVNSFTILKTKNQFILWCWKKIMAYLHQLLDQPSQWQTSQQAAPAQCQNSLAPQLLSNNCWSKTKTSISQNRVYWYDTMCHIFSCFWQFSLMLCSKWPLLYSVNLLTSFFSTSVISNIVSSYKWQTSEVMTLFGVNICYWNTYLTSQKSD